MPIATEIRLDRAAKRLDVSFDDGTHCALPLEYLRVESPSAEVQGKRKPTPTFRRGRGLSRLRAVVG